MGYFAYDQKLTNDDLAQVRFEGATQPGFQESFSSMFPAPRQRWVDSMTVDEKEIRALPHRTLIVHGREDKVIPVANSLPAAGAAGQRRPVGLLALRALVDDRAHGRLQPAGPRLLPRRLRRRTADGRPATGREGEQRPTRSTKFDQDLLRRIYEMMVLTRAVEDRMVAMYKGGDLLGSLYTGHWHEAISVGAASALRPDDYLAPIHRDLGAHLWRGMEPWQVMASFMGKATSPTGGRDGTLHYGRLDLEHLQPAQPHPGQLPGGHRDGVRGQVPRRGQGVPGVLR